jgi:uncharacterized protein YjbI with pentapeptide repeats
MANAEQLSRLKQGVKPWNQWRVEVQNQWRAEVQNQLEALDEGKKEELTQWLADTNHKIKITSPDLSEADLSGADLSGADLSEADLSGADLTRADLSGANLSRANLSRTNLSRANFRGANLSGAHLSDSDLSMADFSDADLSRANLSRANVFRTDFSNTNLVMASFTGADLSRAHFGEADLDSTETTQPPEIEVEIALPQESINQTDLEQLQMAIANLMEVFEFKLKWKLEPIQGSWWQTLIFWSKDKTTQTVVNRLLQTLKEVFVARSIGIPSAEEAVKLVDAVDRVIKCLEPFESGVIRIGNLLVIKGALRGKNSLRVETIAPSLARKLAENPQLIKTPAPLLRLVEEQNIADQTASNLVPLDKPQDERPPDEPLAQLPPSCSSSNKPSDSNAVL